MKYGALVDMLPNLSFKRDAAQARRPLTLR